MADQGQHNNNDNTLSDKDHGGPDVANESDLDVVEVYDLLDSQMDEINNALDFLEQKNDDINEKLKELLKSNINIREQMKQENASSSENK